MSVATTRNFVFNTGGSMSNGNLAFLINSNNTLALSNDTSIVGPATLCNTLTVLKNAYFQSNVTINGVFTFSNNIFALNPLSLSNTLSVSGVTTLSNVLTVTSNLWVNGATSLSNALNVSGVSTFSNALSVTSNIIVGGSTSLSNPVTMSSNLTTYGTATICNVTTLNSNLTFSNMGMVTVYTSNNNLGINTSNPTNKLSIVGGLSVLNNIQSYSYPNAIVPPGNVPQGAATYSSGGITYTFSNAGGNGVNAAWIFDGSTSITYFDGLGAYNTGAGGVYGGTAPSTSNISGAWLQTLSSAPFILTSYAFSSTSQGVKEWYVFGSSDGTTWTQLDRVALSSWTYGTAVTTFNIANPTAQYSYYRFVINKGFSGAPVVNDFKWYALTSLSTVGGSLLICASNSSEQFEFSGGNAKFYQNVYTLSNMAVGKSNPAYTLDVAGTAFISGNTVIGGTTTLSNNLYALNPTSLSNTLDVSGRINLSNALTVTSNLWVNGATSLSNNLNVYGSATISNITALQSNLVVAGTTTLSNNLYALSKLGVGTTTPSVTVEIVGSDAMLIPKGTTPQRPSVPALGHVRYNTDTSQFEGFGAGSAWGSLGGVKSTDQKTFVSAEMYPTSNDGNIRFVNSNIETMRISTIGNVGIGSSNPQVKLEIVGTDAMLIPKGTTPQRPSVPALGHVRYNTDTSQFEGFGAGSAWGSLGGVKSTDQQTFVSAEMYPTSNDGNIRFVNSNAENMRITTAGRVGIATSNPSELVDIVGNTKVGSNLYVMANVGIGTSNPVQNLDIIGSTRVTGTFISAGSCIIRKAQGAVDTSNAFQFYGVNGLSNNGSNLYLQANNAVILQSGLLNEVARFRTGRVDITGDVNFTGTLYNNNVAFSGGGSSQWSTNGAAVTLLGSNVGIGTSNPSYPLHVVAGSNSTSIFAAGDIIGLSDASVKTDLKKITDAVSKVNCLNGYTFRRTDMGDSMKRSAGVIAQEVNDVFPEVITQMEDGKLSVAYGNITALLIEAIKELKADNDQLRARLDILEKRVF